MKKSFVIFAVVAIGAHIAPFTARAQAEAASVSTANTDPIVAYRAYEAAVSAGNFQEAARLGHSAWTLAEAKWGASQANTASLAYNAAWSAALVGKAQDRRDAARRAIELAELGKDAYKKEDAQFLLAYGEFLALPVTQRNNNFRALASAAQAVEATWSDLLIVDALMHAATASVGPSRGRETMALAERTLAAIARLTPSDTKQKAMALTLRGQGRLFTRSDYDEAMADFLEARVSYGVMRQPDDSMWGQLAAWQTAAHSLGISVSPMSQRTGTRISRRTSRPIDMTEAQTIAIYGEPHGECEGVKRITSIGSSVQYPREAANQGIVGAIVIRTDLAADGSTQNVRLLGAVPSATFSDAAVRGVQSWKYEVPVGTPAYCLTDKDIYMSFAFMN